MTYENLPYGQHAEIQDFNFELLSQALKERVYPVVILTGPSGAGKDTIITGLLNVDGLMAERIVRHTSRDMGSEEQQDYTYHFISRPEFEQMIDGSMFMEWGYYGQGYYGTSVNSLNSLSANNGPLVIDLDLDATGVMKQILTRAEVPYLDVMIVPTSAGGNIDDRESVLRVIEERIKARNRGEGEREIHGRLKRARGFLRRSNEVSNILANEEGKQSSAVQSIIELINLQIYARTNQSEI